MNKLKEEYLQLRTDYSSLPLVNDITFDTELVSHKIQDLKRLKAADIYGLSAEHLLFSHPILSTILSKLFDESGRPSISQTVLNITALSLFLSLKTAILNP